MKVETERDFTVDRVKHLEMIQGVIARMANSSAWMKRLVIVVVGGAAALAIRGGYSTDMLPGLAVMLTVVFWLMDARYHQQERWFRALFNAVREENPGHRPDFRMEPSKEIRSQSNFRQSAFSWSSFLYYGALSVFLLLAFYWRTRACLHSLGP